MLDMKLLEPLGSAEKFPIENLELLERGNLIEGSFTLMLAAKLDELAESMEEGSAAPA